MTIRIILLVVFVVAVVGSTTVYCGGCSESGGVRVSGPAGFHVACFDVNGRPYINAVASAWKGDVDGVFNITLDTGMKAVMHGDRCLIEEMSTEQWTEVHKKQVPATPASTTPTPAPNPAPTPSTSSPDAGPAVKK